MNDSNNKIRKSIRSSYKPRIIDDRIETMLSAFGGVLITGPKWCGKSWTGLYHSSSEIMLGDDDINNYAELAPDDALSGEYPRLVDEWQDVPKLWDTARRRIDIENTKGMYIFTGSSVPKNKTHHTGTGRFASVEMKTMSLFESGNSSGAVSLASLFEKGSVSPIRSNLEYVETMRQICRGGWPGTLNMPDNVALESPREYIRSIISSDLSEMTGTIKNPSITNRILRSLARNTTSIIKASTISADVSEEGRAVTDQTIRSYLDSLKQIFFIDEQYAWVPSVRSRTRVRTSPKIHFTDPSLAAAVLNITPDMLAKDTNTAGLLFESLCYRDMSVYASRMNGKVYHYRDSNGLEADSIIQLLDGRWGAIEVKLGANVDKGVETLLRLKKTVDEEPSFLAVVTAKGPAAYTDENGVSVIPIDLLGP